VHSRKCARARVFTFSPFVVVPLLFDVTQDETRNSSCLYTSSPSSFSSSSFQKKPNRQRSRRALKSVNDRKKKERKKGLDKRFKWTKREALVFFFFLLFNRFLSLQLRVYSLLPRCVYISLLRLEPARKPN
jgi:hypothetical protein